MAYQALYRRWRPETFAQMVGQEHIKKTLENQIMSGHIAHAYLFCGSRGTGKTSTAKILARAINCEHPVNGDACGECPSCLALKGETDLDILEIDAASNNGVDEIRDLREKVKYPPQYGRYKVYIIDEVHMLSISAFNALLKTLEEPPEHVVFILATTEPQKLPATILSRCQRFDFGRFTAKELTGRLAEAATDAGIKYTDEALLMIARAAEGGMRDALSILDISMSYDDTVSADVVRRVLGTADKAFMFAFSSAIRDEDLKQIMHLIDKLMRDGKEPQVFLRELSRHMRALLLAQTSKTDLQELLEITKEDAEEYAKEAEGFSAARLIRLLELFQEAEGGMRYAATPRLALEVACVKACAQTQDADVQALNERISQLESMVKKLQSGVIVAKEEKPKSAAPTERKTTPAPKANVPQSEVWNEAKNELKRINPSMFANLMKGEFMGIFGNVYRFSVHKENDIFITLLNKEANKKQLSEILTRLSGKEAVFEAVLAAEKVDMDAIKQEKSVIDSLSETFGKDKLQVKDD